MHERLARPHLLMQRLPRPIRAFLFSCHCEPVRKDLKLVIFEDTPAALKIYSENLGSLEGVRLVNKKPVNSVEGALSVFRKHHPEIVITDLALNKKCKPDGIAIRNEIKRIAPSTIVALCSLHSCKLEVQVSDAGFERVFAKADVEGMKSFITEIVKSRSVSRS